MKHNTLIICMVLIVSLSGVASAQIVLAPPEAGAVYRSFVTVGGTTTTVSYSSVETILWVGGTVSTNLGYNYFYVDHAAFEFYLDPASVPTTNMTANNFTAKLDGLSVLTSIGTGAMNVDLFDMGDGTEDGVITVGDFNSTRGSSIATLAHNFGGAPANFNNVTVTDAVRNDLFGAGAGDFSGFILKPNVTAQGKWLIYDDTPTLTINPVVNPPTDLAVSKTVDDTTPDEGQTITYTITLTNNGPIQATTVSITDLLPAGVTYSSDDGAGSYISGTGVWTVGAINNGASDTLNIDATVDAGTAGSTITNSVTAVSLDQTDSNATPDDLSEAITVNPVVNPPTDLAVSKTVNDTTPDEGQTITYTITLTNNGPIQATTVSITDLLPAGVTYSSDDGAGSYISGTGVWTVGAINNGASDTLNILATVDAGTAGSIITNSVTAVSLDQTDSNATPDDLSEAITVNLVVNPPTDLAVSKTVDDTTPDELQTITYTITLTNNGPIQATTVSITDLLPAGVTYSSDDGAGSYISGTGVWTVGAINNGASATLNIDATVDAGTGCSTITNLVTSVSLDQTDSNATLDDLSEAITVNNVGGCGGGGGGGGGCFIVNAAH